MFVDDLKRNVRSARELGMTAFLYAPGVEVEVAEYLDQSAPADRAED